MKRIIVTPSGERLAVLPETKCLALVVEVAEAAADREAVCRWKAAMDAGEEETLPAALVDRILAGASPVRVWREHRGMSAQALAEAIGIGQPYLSQIETGKRDGTLETMAKLAGALGVLVDDLLSVRD